MESRYLTLGEMVYAKYKLEMFVARLCHGNTPKVLPGVSGTVGIICGFTIVLLNVLSERRY